MMTYKPSSFSHLFRSGADDYGHKDRDPYPLL